MAAFEIPLDIPDVIIEKVEINDDNIKIYVRTWTKVFRYFNFNLATDKQPPF